MGLLRAALIAASAALLLPAPAAGEDQPVWPGRVLITNDNGIEDTALVELARALAKVAETHVVAATTDRSGTSNLVSAFQTREFHVEKRDLGEGINAHALEGYPADCVVFALTGPMRDHPPDLVISGINGGPNLADAWFGSGTIGAARTAAYFGIPALAVSGVEDDDPEAVRAAVKWVVELVRSDVVRDLRPPQYLTVSLPVVAPEEIRGVEITTRGRGLASAMSHLVDGDAQDERQTWRLELDFETDEAPAGTDVAAAMQGKIAIVPMRVDESDPEMAARLRGRPGAFPDWSPPEPAPAAGQSCRSGFGAVIDDAEDASGHEWGVLIEKVLAGGKADEAGLRVGDVIVSMNGVDLAVTDRRSREDPDDRFVKLLEGVICGETVVLDYVRDGERAQVSFRVPDAPRP